MFCAVSILCILYPNEETEDDDRFIDDQWMSLRGRLQTEDLHRIFDPNAYSQLHWQRVYNNNDRGRWPSCCFRAVVQHWKRENFTPLQCVSWRRPWRRRELHEVYEVDRVLRVKTNRKLYSINNWELIGNFEKSWKKLEEFSWSSLI